MRRGLLGIGIFVLTGAAVLSMPSGVDAATYIADDHFVRNLSSGWGQTSPGGTYALSGPAADFWVSTASYPRGIGYMRVPAPRQSRGALLPKAVAANVEVNLSAYISGADGDGPFYVYAAARISSAGEVRAKIIYNRDCSVSTGGSVVRNGQEHDLAAAVKVPNARWCGANRTARTVSLQLQVTGTTVRIRAWPSSGSAPGTWSWMASSSSLPATGAVGLRTYVSSAASHGSDFMFFNWNAHTI